MVSDQVAAKTAEDLLEAGRTERVRLRRFMRYARGSQRMPWLPDNVESEYTDLARKSASNWLDLVVRATAQGLYVDGYGDTAPATNPTMVDQPASLWDAVWQRNGMDARQHALHRAVLTLGYSHLFVFPAEGGGVWMRPDAATQVTAVFEDPSDEWPLRVVREVGKDRFELYTDEARYTISGKGQPTVTRAGHTAGHCPVVEMRASIDLLGRPMGEIEQVIPIQDRIVDATFTLQMVAKYGAFPQRWISGVNMGQPLKDDDGNVVTDSDGNPIFPTIKAYIDSIITATDPDTKFGQFQAADLKQYVEALEAHIRHLAAITQTPPHYLLGSLVNLSAEALAAAEAGLQRKIAEKRVVLGEGYEQAMRLAAAFLGDDAGAADTSSQVRWRDVESRSLAQTSDALLKLSQLGVPVEILLRQIPGMTQQDREEAEQLIRSRGGLVEALDRLAAATTPDPAVPPAA